MPTHFNTKLVFENKDALCRPYEFVKPLLEEINMDRHEDFRLELWCDEKDLSIGFSGLGSAWDRWFLNIPEQLAEAFPELPFRMIAWTDQADYWWGQNIDGKIVLVDHHEEIIEMMFRWHIDVDDPFAGPTEENWAELKRCREQRVQEMIDLGVDIAPGTWPPTSEQEDQEYRFRYKLEHGHFPAKSSDDELPF